MTRVLKFIKSFATANVAGKIGNITIQGNNMGNNLLLLDSGFVMAMGTELTNLMVEFATIDVPEGVSATDMNIAFEFKDDNPAVPACLHGKWKVTIQRDDD